MAIRYRQSSQWAAELTDGDDFAGFLSLFEAKVALKKGAVQSATGCEGKVILEWKRSVGYSGAYAWVNSVISDAFSWRLVDPGDSGAEAIAKEAVASQSCQLHLMSKALFTLQQKGQKRSAEYISQKQVLGTGTFSQVLVARPAEGHQDSFALKKFKASADVCHQLQELYFLERVKSPFVIQVLDVVRGDSPNSLSFVFPLARSTLHAHIRANRPNQMPLPEVERMAKHIAQGLGEKKLRRFVQGCFSVEVA